MKRPVFDINRRCESMFLSVVILQDIMTYYCIYIYIYLFYCFRYL